MRDDFTKRTITEIAKAVSYRCSNPDCRRSTVAANAAQDRIVTIGVAAHIHAASPGGPRFNIAQTPEARRAKENGLWLCQSCGRLIDADPDKFAAETLKKWRRDAQTQAFRELVAPNAAEDIARVEATIEVDDERGDMKFESVFQKIRAAAAADLATYKRASTWSGGIVELTLRKVDDEGASVFNISRLPIAIEAAPEVSIVAPPGTGKTTTLLQLAEHVLNGKSIIPLYFRLGDWSTGPASLLDSLRQRSAFKATTADEMSTLAERGRVLLLLDGWNELAPDSHNRLRIEIGQIRREWPDARIVVTTRQQALDVPISGPRIDVEPLSQDQQIAVANARHGAEGRKIVEDAWRTPGVRELIATPLYLSALLTNGVQGAIGDTKEAILRLFVEQHERAVDHAEALSSALLGCHTAILTELASHLNSVGSTTMLEADARQIVAAAEATLRERSQIVGPLEPIKVLEALISHHTLMRSGGGIAFQHQQFQEWYASNKVVALMRASKSGEEGATVQLRGAVLDRPTWEESILFAAERLSREQGGAGVVAHAIHLALSIDPMLAAEMIYRAAPAVWQLVKVSITEFVARWHKAGSVDRAVRFMIMTGQADFAPQIWPLASSSDRETLIATVRSAPRFRPTVLGVSPESKIQKLPEETRKDLLATIAGKSGVDGMDLAVRVAKADVSAEVQAEVFGSLQFRRADRHVSELLSASREETWKIIAAHGYTDEIQDPTAAAKLRGLQQEALEQATEPVQRLRLLLDRPKDDPDRDTEIATTIADPRFPVKDPQGNLLYLAEQRAPEAALRGIRQRLEAGLELPYQIDHLLEKMDLVDEGPITDTILDANNEDFRLNAAAHVAGPRTVEALIDRLLAYAQTLRTTPMDRALSGEYHRIKDRIRGTRPSVFAAVIVERHSTDPDVISSLASLVFQHGREVGNRKLPLPIDPATKTAWISLLRNWAEIVITAPSGQRNHLNSVANAIGRLGLPELAPELKRLLDEELSRLKRARDGFLDAQRRGDSRAMSDARMLFDNQYCEAFVRIGGDEAARIAEQYLDARDFGFSAALILKSISDKQLNVPEPDMFRRWPWFDGVEAARRNRATSPRPEPLNNYAAPIFAAIERLAKPDADKEDQLFAISLTRIALSMPHGDHDELVDRVMNLPQPSTAKSALAAAIVLDGIVIDADFLMAAIDEWLAKANDPKVAWHKRQDTWEIEPWLELLPFSSRPDAISEGLTKVKAYEKGWARRWERVLGAVAAVPGTQGLVLLETLARSHSDIADDYSWLRAILNRGSTDSTLLYVDLFIEGVVGNCAHGVNAWQAGRQLAGYVKDSPELKDQLRKRYEKIGDGAGRQLLESIFSEVASEGDLLAMVKKYGVNREPFDGEMSRAIEALAVDRVPVSEGANVFNIYPARVGDLRKGLFGLLQGSAAEAALAKRCLVAVDELRDDYGIAANDTRHPDVMSGRPWPPEAANPLEGQQAR